MLSLPAASRTQPVNLGLSHAGEAAQTPCSRGWSYMPDWEYHVMPRSEGGASATSTPSIRSGDFPQNPAITRSSVDFAAARGPNEDNELAVGDIKVNAPENARASRERLLDAKFDPAIRTPFADGHRWPRQLQAFCRIITENCRKVKLRRRTSSFAFYAQAKVVLLHTVEPNYSCHASQF